MECSKCGGKTKVIGTRRPAKPGKGSEVKRAEKVIEWYTSDFIVRLRKCSCCGFNCGNDFGRCGANDSRSLERPLSRA